jgi:hypothetical protein
MDQIEHTEKGGIGIFFFAAIPAVLAGAALMWLAFYTGVIDWTKAQRIEGRMDARVGVHGELTKPVDLIIRKSGCLQVSRAFLDDGKVTSYTTNACHSEVGYWEMHWTQIAPDGTVIASGYDNKMGQLEDGETLEFTQELRDDSRTAKVVVWAQRGSK